MVTPTLHEHVSDVTLIEEVATLAHVITLHKHGSDLRLIENVVTFAHVATLHEHVSHVSLIDVATFAYVFKLRRWDRWGGLGCICVHIACFPLLLQLKLHVHHLENLI